MRELKGWKKYSNSPVLIAMSFIFAIVLFSIGTEWYHYLIGIIGLAAGIHSIYDRKKQSRVQCTYCGYIALDDRELHNHQITCDKKKERESKFGKE